MCWDLFFLQIQNFKQSTFPQDKFVLISLGDKFGQGEVGIILIFYFAEPESYYLFIYLLNKLENASF